MKTVKVYISDRDSRGKYYCSCDVEVPGIGTLEMKDVLSTETIENVFREVEAAARIKLNIVKPETGE